MELQDKKSSMSGQVKGQEANTFNEMHTESVKSSAAILRMFGCV